MGSKIFTIGRGRAFFKPLGRKGFYDFGNISELKITTSAERIVHRSVLNGVKTADRDLLKLLTAEAEFTLDELKDENLAGFFLGKTEQSEREEKTFEVVLEVEEGVPFYPTGFAGSELLSVSRNETVYAKGADYSFDSESGMLEIAKGITSGYLKICGNAKPVSVFSVKAGKENAFVGDLLFMSKPPVGRGICLRGKISLTADGSLELVSGNWSSLAFRGVFLKNDTNGHLFEIFSYEKSGETDGDRA